LPRYIEVEISNLKIRLHNGYSAPPIRSSACDPADR
jgi:hypothetical protein